MIDLEKWRKQNDYLIYQRDVTKKQEELRGRAWQEEKCQQLYNKMIESAGGLKRVRKGMRGQAKQHAITSYLKGIEPDYEKFKKSVEIANQKRYNYKKRKYKK